MSDAGCSCAQDMSVVDAGQSGAASGREILVSRV